LSDAAPPKARGARTGWALIAFVGVMAVALAATGWSDAATAMARLTVANVAALFLLALAHYTIRAVRWHRLVRASGVPSGFRRNLIHLFGGFAMTATPGRLGELIRLRWLQRETGLRFTRLLPVAFADRAIELASILLLVVGMLAFSSLGTSSIWALLALVTAIVVVACQPRLLEAAILGLWRAVGRRKPRLFAKLRRMVLQLRPVMRPTILVPVLLIGILGWASEGIAFWLLLGWLDIPLSLPVATSIFMVAILAGTLSGLPGGLGGTEATGIALLTLQSVPLDSAVVAILIIRVTTLWFAVLIGMLVFPVAELNPKGLKDRANAVS